MSQMRSTSAMHGRRRVRRLSTIAVAVAAPGLLWGMGLRLPVGDGSAIDARTARAAVPKTPDDWPWWRGLHEDGSANSHQSPPLHWSDSHNVAWKTPIPGRGHGSPIAVDHRVFLATADEKDQTQSLLCLNRWTGELLWSRVVHRGNFVSGGHQKNTHASATPACDGERVFITFLNDHAVHCSAVSVTGDILWQRRVSDFVIHQGFGASPRVYGELVLVSADHKGGGAVAGLNRVTGEIVWRQPRPATANYASPIVLRAAGRDQLILTGCNRVASYHPLTGEPLWEVEGSTTECVTSTVTDGNLVFSTGGYPRNHVQAVRADGSGEIVWQKNDRLYVPSPLIRDGFLYLVLDEGVAVCWRASDGHEQWKARLGGTFSSSPVRVGDLVYATSESGQTTIFKAIPDRFEKVAENQLGDEVFATPVIAAGCIYHRVAVQTGDQRQEWLYCLGAE